MSVTPDPTSTRARMLDTMANLLRSQGYAATGLKEVLVQSGAPKGSLYFHFPDGKEQLAAEAVRLSGERVAAAIERMVVALDDPAEVVRALTRGLAAQLPGQRTGLRRWCRHASTETCCPLNNSKCRA